MTTLRRLLTLRAARTPAFFAALALGCVLLAPADAFCAAKRKEGQGRSADQGLHDANTSSPVWRCC